MTHSGELSTLLKDLQILNVSLEGKATKFSPFAAGNAIKVGKEVLISCGTEPIWGVLTSSLPLAQTYGNFRPKKTIFGRFWGPKLTFSGGQKGPN